MLDSVEISLHRTLKALKMGFVAVFERLMAKLELSEVEIRLSSQPRKREVQVHCLVEREVQYHSNICLHAILATESDR